MRYTRALAAGLLAASTQAHMQLAYPPPFRGYNNPHTKNIDYDHANFPLGGLAGPYPCLRYQVAMNDPTGEGAPTATWAAGGSAHFALEGSAVHGGGSCQASLSYDKGKTFKVIHSWIGACGFEKDYQFTIPSDAPHGEAVFAWSWFNLIGNREMYMRCASVTITGGEGGSKRGITFQSRPDIFVANVDNSGCKTIEGHTTVFPNPGPDVTGSSLENSGITITDTCQAVSDGSNGSDPKISSSYNSDYSRETATSELTTTSHQMTSSPTGSPDDSSTDTSPPENNDANIFLVDGLSQDSTSDASNGKASFRSEASFVLVLALALMSNFLIPGASCTLLVTITLILTVFAFGLLNTTTVPEYFVPKTQIANRPVPPTIIGGPRTRTPQVSTVSKVPAVRPKWGYIIALVSILSIGSTRAHMTLDYPPAFHGATNPYTKKLDSNLNAPLTVFSLPVLICKGYYSELKDPAGEGTPTAHWKQGGSYNFTIKAGAPHGGGSCQIALSYDQGTTYTVLHTYEGGCGAGNFDFKVPSDAPVSKGAMFIWLWYNMMGNREIYTNCAAVTIEAGTGDAPSVPFNKRPDMAFLNLMNPVGSCEVPDSTEAVFPDPGPDVTKNLTKPDTSGKVTADCVETNRKYLRLGRTADMASVGGSYGASTYGSSTGGSGGSSNSGSKNGAESSAATVLASGITASSASANGYYIGESPSSTPASVKPIAQTGVAPSASSVDADYATTIASNLPQKTSDSSAPGQVLTIHTVSTSTVGGYGSASSNSSDACGAVSTATVTVTVSQIAASSAPSASPSPDSSAVPQSTLTIPFYSSSLNTSSPASSTSASPSSSPNTGGITTDGTCGPDANGTTCKGSVIYGACCSLFGHCGILDAHCGTGCLETFGVCGDAGKTANPGISKRVLRGRQWSA